MCCWLSGLRLDIQPWSCAKSKSRIHRTELMVLTGFLPFWDKGMQEAFTDTEESLVGRKISGKNGARFIPGHHDTCAPQCPSLPVRQRFPIYSLFFSTSAFGPSHQVAPAWPEYGHRMFPALKFFLGLRTTVAEWGNPCSQLSASLHWPFW